MALVKRTSAASSSTLALAPEFPYIAAGSLAPGGYEKRLRIFDYGHEGSPQLLAVASSCRPVTQFRRLAWSRPTETRPLGLLAGGFHAGVVAVWNPTTSAYLDHGHSPATMQFSQAQQIGNYLDDAPSPDGRLPLPCSYSGGDIDLVRDMKRVFGDAVTCTKFFAKEKLGFNRSTRNVLQREYDFVSSEVCQGIEDDGWMVLNRNESDDEIDLAFLISDHTGPVLGLQFSKIYPHVLASAAMGERIRVYDLSDSPHSHVYISCTECMDGGEECQVSSLAWNPRWAATLASTSHSGATKLWDIKRKEPVARVFHSPNVRCSAIEWKPDDCNMFLVAFEVTHGSPPLELWDMRLLKDPVKKFGGTNGVVSISWHPCDSRRLLTSSEDGRVTCWDTETEQALDTLPSSVTAEHGVHWCINATNMFAASASDVISVYQCH